MVKVPKLFVLSFGKIIGFLSLVRLILMLSDPKL